MFDDECCKICEKEKSTLEHILSIIKPPNPDVSYMCPECIENLLEGINKFMLKKDAK